MEIGRLSIARNRRWIWLRLAATAASDRLNALCADAGEMDLESLSAFDVPAFLRREG